MKGSGGVPSGTGAGAPGAMPSGARRAGAERLPAALSAAFGFACACPLLLGAGANVRLNDVAAVLAAALAGASLFGAGRLDRSAPFYLAVGVLTLGWIWAEIHYTSYMPGHPPAAMLLVRWIVAVPSAYVFSVLSADPATRKPLMCGLILGLLADTALLGYDYAVFQATGHPAFQQDPTQVFYVYRDYRAGGILGHPNGAAIASTFAVPFLIGAAEEFRWGWVAGALAAAVAVLVFLMTQTRSAMIAAAVLLLVWRLTARPGQTVAACLAAASLLTVFLALDPTSPGGAGEGGFAGALRRFTDQESVGENTSGRLETMLNALGLAVEHPFGLGSAYAPALGARAGYEATHNALLQLALLGGLPLTFFITAVLVAGASRVLRRGRTIENWAALYFLIVAMFEAIFFSPFVSLFVLWLAGRLAVQASTDPAHARAAVEPDGAVRP